MTTTVLQPTVEDASTLRPPTRARRAAIATAAGLGCALPTVFAVATVTQLATGAEADHRFHQLTGQGLLLSALWLSGLLPLAFAGWRGRVPSVGAGLHALTVAGTALFVGALAPGAGGMVLAVVCAVTTALLWASLSVRPQLRGVVNGLDPLIAPVAMLAAALLTPFIVGEIGHQNHTHDEHTDMAHYFDMAWVSLTLVVLGALAAVAPAVRRRASWPTGGLVLIGASRMAFTPDVTWSALAMALGAMGTFALVVRDRK